MIKRYYYIGIARYLRETGQFCGNTWKVVTHKSWLPNPSMVVEQIVAEIQEELPDQMIYVTSVQRV